MKQIVEYLIGKNSKSNKFIPLNRNTTYEKVVDDLKGIGFNTEYTNSFIKFFDMKIDMNFVLCYENYPEYRLRFLTDDKTMFIFAFDKYYKIKEIQKREFHDAKQSGKDWEITYLADYNIYDRTIRKKETIENAIDEINSYFN